MQHLNTSVARIGKLFGAQNAGQLITVLAQLLLPPAFLRAYGVSLYGQWLAIGAAIGYLSTFNYGLQTYANMQMTIHYNRGEIQETRNVQSAGLRILLASFLLFNTALLAIFLMPVTSWLELTISNLEAQWTLYILGCQIVTGMIFGFFSSTYMVIGLAHRGANIGNVQQIVALALQVILVTRRSAFHWIAAAQLAVTGVGSILLIYDLGQLAPDLRPTLRYWTPGSLRKMLEPSAHFALLYSSNVLAYQLPTILMQRLLGPTAVVVYSVTRTVYSMSRRFLYLLTNSIGPEITLAFGQRDWKRLYKLYDLSERMILLMTTPITIGSMVATPLLLELWLHKKNLYDPSVCLLLGLSVTVLSIKEHKYQFQFSSNQVQSISYMTLLAYCAQLLLAGPVMVWFGLIGYLTIWCGNEIFQLFYLLRLNELLFAHVAKIDRKPVYRLFGVLAIGILTVLWPVYHMDQLSLSAQLTLALTAALLTFVVSYRLFHADEVRILLWQKLAARCPYFAAKKA